MLLRRVGELLHFLVAPSGHALSGAIRILINSCRNGLVVFFVILIA